MQGAEEEEARAGEGGPLAAADAGSDAEQQSGSGAEEQGAQGAGEGGEDEEASPQRPTCVRWGLLWAGAQPAGTLLLYAVGQPVARASA